MLLIYNKGFSYISCGGTNGAKSSEGIFLYTKQLKGCIFQGKVTGPRCYQPMNITMTAELAQLILDITNA